MPIYKCSMYGFYSLRSQELGSMQWNHRNDFFRKGTQKGNFAANKSAKFWKGLKFCMRLPISGLADRVYITGTSAFSLQGPLISIFIWRHYVLVWGINCVRSLFNKKTNSSKTMCIRPWLGWFRFNQSYPNVLAEFKNYTMKNWLHYGGNAKHELDRGYFLTFSSGPPFSDCVWP